ncbi:zinc finger protein 761-like [Athalia rosae]|uniref:zinc finger protein 761-like n=1 Tax=Athalia rosae TaxID=37344 RepID=UPI0020333EF3|nr:zinc finger protein 761-like [Athalia rosae]
MFIVTKEIDSENISKLCRTCLREDGEKMVCLFVGPAGSSLAAKLRSLSCLEVWQGDGLPEKMCDRCVTRAESALLYREQCRAADRALRQAAIKVSGLTSYTTVSGCKLYQQNQGFVPIQNSQKTLKCIECGAVFVNYQELCEHSRLHVPSVQNTTPVQHMHIVEPQNNYFNINNLNSNLVVDDVHGVQIPSLLRSNSMNGTPVDNEEPSRAACALHCSLCNHTFTNRTQLISHNFTHSSDHMDLSSGDNTNIEVSEDSNQIAQNLSYDRTVTHVGEDSIQNLSFPREIAVNDTRKLRNLNFSANNTLNDLQENRNRSFQCLESNGIQISENLAFSKVSENSLNHQPNESELNMTDGSIAKDKKHKCSLCPKSFAQKSKLMTHQFSHTGQRPFKCTICEKAYASKSKLNAHVRLHTKTNVHVCTICSKTFAFASYLEDHLKSHKYGTGKLNTLKESTFDCAICDKKFRFIKNFKAHLRLHTGENLVQCEYCDKRFSQKYNLKVHLESHKDLKAYKCEFCEKCFNQHGNLVEHLRIHNKLKPYKCDLCGKCFSQSSHLRNHKISHNTEREHSCRLCGKKFKLASHLKRHLDLHTGRKSYKCAQCNQMFSQSFSLKRHLKRHADIHI